MKARKRRPGTSRAEESLRPFMEAMKNERDRVTTMGRRYPEIAEREKAWFDLLARLNAEAGAHG